MERHWCCECKVCDCTKPCFCATGYIYPFSKKWCSRCKTLNPEERQAETISEGHKARWKKLKKEDRKKYLDALRRGREALKTKRAARFNEVGS